MFTRLARHASLTATLAIGALCAAAVALPQAAQAAPKAPAVTYTHLTLINGWHNDAADGATKAQVTDISGIITFKGAIFTNGTNAFPFVLPRAFRPATTMFVPVDLCDANYGRLFIKPSGVVQVESESTFSNATCFTSLDGVSFAKSGASFTALKLQNGWKDFGNGTAKPEVRVISGIVHLRGAMRTTGPGGVAFTLPKGFRPASNVYIPVDLCGPNHGRLFIKPNGTVEVAAEISFLDAQCLTSLDGASFARSGASFTPLTLRNGWHGFGAGTAKAAVRLISGVVHFRGGIATSGSNPTLFTLPKAFRPAHNVWTPVNLCGANNGRLYIQPSGVVQVEEEGSTFSHAACFTSLDGAWFAR